MNVIDRQTHTKHNNIAKVIQIWTKQKRKEKINKEEVMIKAFAQ